jgi:predicted permease
MGSFLRDLRFAVRLLLKSPGFTVIAVLTLAVGIGANTTVFSWMEGILLRPLPEVPRQQDVRVIWGYARDGGLRSLSVPNVRDMQKSLGPLRLVASAITPANLTGGERPERIWASLITGDAFDVLQVKPALGRGFLPEEDATPNTHPVAVLGYDFWQRRFLGDPKTVGSTIQLNGHPYTVVGVAPRGFIGTEVGLKMDLWVPLAMQPQLQSGGSRLEKRGNNWLQGIVRLRSGATQAQAQAALDALAIHLEQKYPDSNDGERFRLYPFWDAPSGASGFLRPVLLVLGVMAALVLLLACANVANLLLVRALGRRKEVAIRISLGAGRGRLLAQLMTESLLLVTAAGGLGLLLAVWGSNLLLAAFPPTDAPIVPSFPIDARVVLFAAAVSLATGLVFSLAPAAQLAAPGIALTLRDEGGAVAGGRKGVLRSGLVVAQIIVSCVLLITAGLFVRSLGKADGIDPGFQARNVLLARLDIYPNGYDEPHGKAFYRQLLERLAARPGVEAVTVSTLVPLDFDNWSTSLTVDGYQAAPKEEITVSYYIVGPGYLHTLGVPLAGGRDFTAQDDERAPKAIIINQAMADKYWRGRQALGGRVTIDKKNYSVVGITRTGKYHQLSETPQPLFYIPVLQDYQSGLILHVRTAGDPLRLVDTVRSEVRALNPDIPLATVTTMRQHLRISVFSQRLAAIFLGAFGVLALLLATLGLYSVIRFTVSQRTRELGVRAALGARPGQIACLVVDQGMRLAALGMLVGVGAAFGLTRFLASQLLGVSTTDPLVFATVAVLLVAVSALASWLPAQAAAAVDPNIALRAE